MVYQAMFEEGGRKATMIYKCISDVTVGDSKFSTVETSRATTI